VSRGPWRVELTRTAQRDLRRLDPPVRTCVDRALRELAADPHRGGQLRKLGAPEWRLRVGDWRALVLLDQPQRVIQYEQRPDPVSPRVSWPVCAACRRWVGVIAHIRAMRSGSTWRLATRGICSRDGVAAVACAVLLIGKPPSVG